MLAEQFGLGGHIEITMKLELKCAFMRMGRALWDVDCGAFVPPSEADAGVNAP